MNSTNQQFSKHWKAMKRARNDSNLERRRRTIETHLRRWYGGSPEFLEQFTAIILEAAFVTEPARLQTLRSLRERANSQLEIFLKHSNTLASEAPIDVLHEIRQDEQHEQHQSHKVLEQPEQPNHSDQPEQCKQYEQLMQSERNKQTEETSQQEQPVLESHSSLMN
ncbi:hypothetical protein BGX28_001458, partial [Mortierella sp. GBA30]